ncbi:hypothetical protein [uncultured Roseovarius sp.]|uniref:hypothetical protein n=1 Tax=uncultured Roseovarius sp. TaxID=293344 RepID=UPI002610E0FC|nr:hypothetical protein [uncultured Roseovarius sp.]
MLGIFANTFRTATRTDTGPETRHRHQGRAHWPPAERFDARSGADLEAHLVARRRY